MSSEKNGDFLVRCPDCGKPENREIIELLGHCSYCEKGQDEMNYAAFCAESDAYNKTCER